MNEFTAQELDQHAVALWGLADLWHEPLTRAQRSTIAMLLVASETMSRETDRQRAVVERDWRE